MPRLTQLHDIWRQDVKWGSLLQSLPALTTPYSLLVSTHWLMSPAGPLLEPRGSEEELHPLLPRGVPRSSDFPVWPGQGLWIKGLPPALSLQWHATLWADTLGLASTCKKAFDPHKSPRFRGGVVEGSRTLPNEVLLRPWLWENLGRCMGKRRALPLHSCPFSVELQESTTQASTGWAGKKIPTALFLLWPRPLCHLDLYGSLSLGPAASRLTLLNDPIPETRESGTCHSCDETPTCSTQVPSPIVGTPAQTQGTDLLVLSRQSRSPCICVQAPLSKSSSPAETSPGWVDLETGTRTGAAGGSTD